MLSDSSGKGGEITFSGELCTKEQLDNICIY